MTRVDLRQKERIEARDIDVAGSSGASEVLIAPQAVIPDEAKALLARYAIAVRFAFPASATAKTPCSPPLNSPDNQDHAATALFHSPEALALKEEICAVGRKLWLRGFVDGNGGNISCRIGDNEVICTPTLFSKFDLTPDDLCLVDLDGQHLAGRAHPTSEVRLHLEIYKNSAQAKAVVHCHSPYATAYSICGRVPPTAISSEFDVFIGSVALARYETPGTSEFAETVRPYVAEHNAILLANHGVVCWADTPTHAEWYVENLESCCQTFLIARQLGVPYSRISPEKEEALRSARRRLGLPDGSNNSSCAPALS